MTLVKCPKCGALVSDTADSCPYCGYDMKSVQPVAQTEAQPAPTSAPKETCPPSHLAKSIVLTLLCCWPFGIPAIVNAAKVERLFFSGHIEESKEASAKAAKWCNITIIVGCVFWVLYLIIIVLIGLGSSLDQL